MGDFNLSELVANYRLRFPRETEGKSDVQVAGEMLSKAEYADVQEKLMSFISGNKAAEEGVGDSFRGGVAALYRDDAPPAPDEGGKKGILAAIFGGIAGVLTMHPKTRPIGIAMGGLTLAGTLTSCSEKTEINIDHGDISITVDQTGLSDAIKELGEKLGAKLDTIVANQEATNALLANMNALLVEIANNTSATNEELAAIKLMLEKIQTVLDGLKTGSEAYNTQVILLLNEILTNQETANAQDKAFYEQVITLITDLNAKLGTVGAEVAEKLAPFLQQITADIQKGNDINQAGFAAVLEALKNIDANNQNNANMIIDAVKGLWADVKNGNTDAIALLKEISNDVKAGNVINQDAVEKVIAAIEQVRADNKANTEAVIAVIKGLWDDVKAGDAAILEGLGGITQLVAKLDFNTDKIADVIKNLKIDFPAQKDYSVVLNAILDAVQKGVIPGIEDLKDQFTAQIKAFAEQNHADIEGLGDLLKDAFAHLENVVKSSNIDLTTTNNLIQTVIDLMGNTNNPTFDDSAIVGMLTQTNKMLEALLNKEGPDMQGFKDALNEIKDAINNIKVTGGGTDLTTTNNLIQTVIDSIGSLIDSNANNRDIMAQVTSLGTQLTSVIASLQQGNVTTADIEATLKRIEESVNALLAKK